jgi:mannose-6-phosphate isomerase-like protein (cupin superfamily)
MESERQAVFVPPGEGRVFLGNLTCRVSSASTLGEYCAFEFVASPGEGVPLHMHNREDEVYYILEGTFEIRCGGRVFTAVAGAMAVLPRKIPHAFRNPGTTPSRALTTFIPGGFDIFVQELDALSPQDAADESKRNSIRRKYGIQMLEEGTSS